MSETKFKVGDKVKLMRHCLYIRCYGSGNHLGAVGEVLELRSYRGRCKDGTPTHYVIKFDCYKIAHIYPINEIDNNCELIKSKQV